MLFRRAMILGGAPSLFMLVSTCIGLGKVVPEDVSGALQHFAAGVLLCTVGTELLPKIVDAQGWAENIASLIGFFLGVSVLILLGLFSPIEAALPADDDDQIPSQVPSEHYNRKKNGKFDSGDDNSSEDGDDDSVSAIFRSVNGGNSPTPGQKRQLMKFVIAGRKFRQPQKSYGLLPKRSMSLSSLPVTEEDQPLMSSSSKREAQKSYTEQESEEKPTNEVQDDRPRSSSIVKQFPLAFVLAVAIDSSLDGLLIGIASVAGPSAGPMMSASLSVEMSFLGITLATALHGQPFSRAALAAAVGPACLVLAAGLGGMMADTLSHSPVALVCMLSFGTSALLFMVAEELLLDAHVEGAHVWWVDLQLYTGFFASMIAGKFVPE